MADWTVTLGIGGVHDASFRYAAEKPVAATLTITDAEGTVLATKRIFLPAVPSGEWGLARLDGGVSLNAGTFRFRLALPDSAVLALDALNLD